MSCRFHSAAVFVVLCVSFPAQGQTRDKFARDLFGEFLPPGAIARLGHSHFYHADQIRRIALSPNGKTLACATVEQTSNVFPEIRLHLWNTANGKKLAELRLPDQASPRDLAFSPSGRLLAVIQSGAVSVWDVERRRKLHQQDEGGGGIRFSADEKKLFALGGGSLRVLDPLSGKLLSMKRTRHFYHGMAVHPDDKHFVWAGDSGVMMQAIEGDEEPRRLAPLNRLVWDVAFRPDGKILVINDFYAIRALEFPSGKLLWKLDHFGTGQCANGLAFSPNGNWLIYGEEGVVCLDATTGHEVENEAISGLFCSFSRDGKRLAVADGHRASMVDVEAKRPRLRAPIPGEKAKLYFHDNATIQTISESQGANTWAARTGKHLGRQANPSKESPWSPRVFCPEKRWFLQALEKHLRVIDAKTGAPIAKLPTESNTYAGAFWLSGDGKRVFEFRHPTGKNPATLLAFEVSSGKQSLNKTLRLSLEVEDSLSKVVAAPNGKWLAMLAFDRISFFDPSANRELSRIRNLTYRSRNMFVQGEFASTDYRVSPDGRFFLNLIGPEDGPLLALHEVRTGRCIHALPMTEGSRLTRAFFHRDYFNFSSDLDGQTCLLTQDARFLITGSDDIEIWEIPSARPCAVLETDGLGCIHLALSPDGKTLASTCRDGAVLLWDLEKITKARPRILLGCSHKEFNAAWQSLSSDEAPSTAFLTLLHDPKRTLAAIRKEFPPVPHGEEKVVQRLLFELKNPNYAVRQTAQKNLIELQEGAGPALEKELARPDVSLEQKRRLEKTLASIQGLYTTPTRRRQWYALDLVERIGGEEARAILREWSHGNPDAELTREAEKRLRRWKR